MQTEAMQSEAMIGLIALGGVIVGGLIGVSGQWLLVLQEQKRKAKAIARALAGEIRAFVEDATSWRRAEVLRDAAKRTRAEIPTHVAMAVNEDYLTVFRAVCSDIGMLPGDLAHDVARFYSRAMGQLDNYRAITAESTLPDWYEDIAGAIDETSEFGNDLWPRLEEAGK